MNTQLNIERHRGLLMKLANGVAARCHACGQQSVRPDEVFQELAIAWCIARDKWQPETGVPFGAYLIRGARNHINRWADREILAHNWAHLDLDSPGSDDSDEELHGIIGDPDFESAEDTLARKNAWDSVMSALSPRAHQFCTLLANPPIELMKVLDMQKERRDFARDRGVLASSTQKKVTMSMVFDLMGAERVERARITSEIALILDLDGMTNEQY